MSVYTNLLARLREDKENNPELLIELATMIAEGDDFSSLTEKDPPVDADIFPIQDSEDGYSKKHVQISNIPVDHDTITNTHNLTTDIDHDTITNNHNLTTDIKAATIDRSIVTKTNAYTLTSSDYIVLGDTNAFTLTLPTAVGITGKIYIIKKINTEYDEALTIDGNASETIDGSTTYVINTVNSGIIIVSNGSNWQIIGIF